MSDYAKTFGVVGNTLIFALGDILAFSLARHYEPEKIGVRNGDVLSLRPHVAVGRKL